MWEHSFTDLMIFIIVLWSKNLTDRKLLVHTKHNRLFVTNRLQITSHYTREQLLINLLSIKKSMNRKTEIADILLWTKMLGEQQSLNPLAVVYRRFTVWLVTWDMRKGDDI